MTTFGPAEEEVRRSVCEAVPRQLDVDAWPSLPAQGLWLEMRNLIYQYAAPPEWAVADDGAAAAPAPMPPAGQP